MYNRFPFGQAVWVDKETAAVIKTMSVNGCCEQIAVKVSDNTGNRTATVTITDNNGAVLFTKSGISKNATTTYFARSYKVVQDADFNPFLSVDTLTATITPLGDPGANGMTVDVYLYTK